MNIKDLKEKYNLNESSTGGNCMALSTDLNTKQDQILITSDDLALPYDDADNFTIAVFLGGEYGEPAHVFETTNIDHLDELVDAVFSLWGN